MIANCQQKAIQTELFPRSYEKYAYRLETKKVKEPDFPYPQKQLTCTTDLLRFVEALKDSDVEKMIILYLNSQNELIGINIIPGTINQAAVFPREVIKHALLFSACPLILVHNHPSGNSRPSEADIRLTKTITEAAKFMGMLVHDHLIVSERTCCSFRDEGLMPLD